MNYLSFSLVSAAALVALAWPVRDAQACSPPGAALTGSIPPSGATYPANAAIFFQGYDISLDAVSVTVDGQPASFTTATDVSSSRLAAITARVSPTPAAGQTVRIFGTFCAAPHCEVSDITYVTSAPDTTPPASPASLSFDVHDYTDFESSGGDCQSSSDAAWWIEVGTTPPQPTESPVVVVIEGSRNESFDDVVFSSSAFVSAATTNLNVRRLVDEALNGPLAEDFCIRASVRDAAGNEAVTVVQACRPCHFRKESTMTSFGPPQEPAWTDDDIYEGGTCDADGGGDGDGDGDDDDGGTGPRRIGGCGCSVGERAQPTPVAWLAAFAAGIAGARLVRRPRR